MSQVVFYETYILNLGKSTYIHMYSYIIAITAKGGHEFERE